LFKISKHHFPITPLSVPYFHLHSLISIKLQPLPKVTIFFHLGHKKIHFFFINKKKETKMTDWAPVVIGVVLFVFLQPGLLFSFPGNGKQLEFGGMKTNGKAIFIHTLIFFGLYAVILLALKVHIYTG
jgi:hypothetical protein